MLRPEPPRVDPESLYPRRLAWRALELVLDQYGLSAIALKLNPDDPSEAFPGAIEGTVLFGERLLVGRSTGAIATVEIQGGTRARVLVENVRRLVRRNHLKDFREGEVGIVRRPGQPDIDVDVDLADLIERYGELMRTAPQRVPPRRPALPEPRVISALTRTRGR